MLSSSVDAGLVVKRPSEADVVRCLTDASLNKRDGTLEQLRVWLQASSGRQPLADPVSVFRGIAAALTDDVWGTRYQSVKLIEELIPLLEPDEVDRCLQVALRPLVRCLGDPKVTVRMAASDALDLYSDQTGNFGQLLESITRFGVLSDSPSTRKAILTNLAFLFAEKNSNRDFQTLVTALLGLLSEDICSGYHTTILHILDRISMLVGEARFHSYLKVPLPDLCDRYYRLSKKSKPQSRVNSASLPAPVSEDIVYGLIPSRIIVQLDDRRNIHTQLRATEELKEIVISAPHIRDLQPHLTNFLMFVAGLLQEKTNFQVSFALS